MQPDNPMPERRTISPVLICIIVIAILALSAAGLYAVTRSGSTTDSTSQTATTNESTTPTTTSSADTSTTYQDGNYTKIGDYSTPGGQESITVTATLSNGTITSISATGSGNDGDSQEYQAQFLSGYKSLVVGKSINDIHLSRVAGSSLTSNGFNAAIEKIMEDAKA